MSTLNLAQAKWERKMGSTAPANWKRGVTGASGRYAAGMARFLGGGSINSARVQAYEAGVNAVGAGEFAQAVSGKGAKWAEGLRRAFGA